MEKKIAFEYRQVGTYYYKDSQMKKVSTPFLCKFAREENLNHNP